MTLSQIMSILPTQMWAEIRRILSCRGSGDDALNEVRLRRDGLCTVRVNRENIRLFSRIDRSSLEEIVRRVLGGALYAHRDSISSGYVTLDGGVRVGMCGRASYDGGRLVGISEISSLVFRIPTGRCAFSREIYEIFRSGVGAGMLIYSPPGVGKTTALRSLARSIGSGGKSVSVVDERCEFCPEDYSDCEVDILRGYRRKEGIEIATRTLSPDVIMIDELSGEECNELGTVVRCGIPIVATVHASSAEEIRAKPSLSPLLSCRAFETLVGISCDNGKYTLRTDKI